ncbi:MAG TPA: acetyltransferase [Candidatus Acidoferrum sp.]|nr:acetyltransferase [Candidatus Acidoferrum sp.]
MSVAPVRVVVWGAGGHALVVADILRLTTGLELVGFLDDDAGRRGEAFGGLKILGGQRDLQALRRDGVEKAAIAFGDCAGRLAAVDVVVDAGLELHTAVHPRAIVADSAVVGAGTVVAAGAIIGVAARIGRAVIVNTAASIDHECEVDDGAHIGPGARLGGRVVVGRGAWVGIGATVRDRITIGEASLIGAGAVVVRDVPARVVAYGVPASIRRGVGNAQV